MNQRPAVRTPKALLLFLAIRATYPAGAQAQPAQGCRDADLLVRNAKIVTMGLDGGTAQAMAVRDANIVAIGSDEQVAACAGPQTQTVNLAGKTVLPGLIDVHTHALDWAKGILRNEIDMYYPHVRSIRAIAELVRDRAAAAKPGEWLVGSGWDHSKLDEQRYITRQDLDAVSPSNPVYLVHVSGHLAAANSVALRLAGITSATRDPPGGVIERDARGEPTGIVKDNAMGLVARLLPPDPPDLAVRAVRMVSELALEVGLTTIHDISLSSDDMRGYQEAYRRGWLRVRVQMVPLVSSVADAEQLVRTGVHTGFGDDMLKLGAVKMFADGGMGARTIAIYPPPLAGEPENLGLLIWKAEDMQNAHRLLAAAGWQLVTHAIGDRAIDQVLDSYAATMQALGLRDPRFRIAHCGVSTPAVQKRLRELRVIADSNPAFVYWIGSWFLKYGPERARWSYPGKSYIENGVLEAAGSDVSVTPISPWWGIWAAVVRRDLATGQVIAPEERLTAREALQLYTRNGAYDGFEEDKKGSLKPSKLADFIVVDRDVLTIPPDELKDVQVLQTYVGGRRVFEKQPAR